MSSEAHGSLRAIFYALGANFGIALAKSAAAWFTHSGAMLAEAIHSFADCANQALLLIGLKRAKKPADVDHPLGHGKTIYFWSFIVALMLFSMGGMFSVYEGVHKVNLIRSGAAHELNHPWVAIIVLSLGIVLEGLSLWGALKESRPLRRGQTLWNWFRTSRNATFLVIIGEDLAAQLGLAIALVAVIASMVTGNPIYDALGSIGIGVLLIFVAIVVGVEIKSLLIGESAEPRVREAIRAQLDAQPLIADVLNVITLQMGSEVMVAVKAKMTEQLSVEKMVKEINQCERELKEMFPEVKWVFFEPDTQP